MKRFALVVVAALMLAGCAQEPAPPSVHDIQAKADAFHAEVAAATAAEAKALKDKTTILVEPNKGRALRVLFAGDSVTAGVGASSDAQSYREHVLTDLRKYVQVEPIVAATAGATTAVVSPSAVAAGAGFDLVIVELGTNDMEQTDPGKFKTDYATLIKQIREKSPKAGLVCAGLWQPTSTAKAFDASVTEACAAAGGQYRPLGGIFTTATNRASSGDTFHPNDAGHLKIASQLLTALRYS